ncbi:unnamed protein product [Rhizoctonia solani]|uniref:F-box domain-containing protein n=1 Tax=Rhizoctonia solani TaxID=456999 RepID=A0A8H3DRF1_9AGAM|nr:unnamed protein product [Rhizoctonia solani]CAE6540895.1 unnamed protein product [Rhizoctonia solani]
MIEQTMVTVNCLPPEILMRIFHIVVADPCTFYPYYSSYTKQYYRYPRYLDYLVQVCSLWRTIAISAQTLWRHIDLSPNKPFYDGLVYRAINYMARAGELPIELHIAVPETSSLALKHDEAHQLISLISSRVESLELTMAGSFQEFHRGVFKLLLCQRSALTKLVLRSQAYHYNCFLVATSFASPWEDDYTGPQKLDLTEEEIERSFASLTILHLRGIFPLWSSMAYHGLADLRLLSTNTWSYIQEKEFIDILKSCPGLQILHFQLEIHSPTPVAEKVTPVILQDLQVVKIITSIEEESALCPSNVLRILAPGTKFLRLSFEGYYRQKPGVIAEFERFFARSRVARFYSQTVLPPLDLLLHQSTHLDQVILNSIQTSYHTRLSPWLEVDKLALLPRLRSIQITRSGLYDHALRLLLSYCPDGIVLINCDIYHSYDSTTFDAQEISKAFPTVVIMNGDVYSSRSPIADWDSID